MCNVKLNLEKGTGLHVQVSEDLDALLNYEPFLKSLKSLIAMFFL